MSSPGFYIGTRISLGSIKKLKKFGKALNIPRMPPASEFHTTIVYSKTCIDMKPIRHNKIIDPQTYRWEMFGKKKNILVLCYDSLDLQNRFNYAVSLGATHDYDIYNPHVTISFDYKGDIAKLPLPKFPIIITEEYHEDIKIKE